jgi:hypothetical protein
MIQPIDSLQATKITGNEDVKLLSELYTLLNDNELAANDEKKARYSQLHNEAEKRRLI